ncbi:amino acid ABC transporter permease [Actinacidiphila acididurans]|uniref:Amino acid ABC transporter permease n=1 Tax=Actinacidiphila acididurans TaxID=2784346 RepID=A0ABS2TTJ3_9ACTN|nr:amino acid ABC transporter permease [Actinacidiphila acididurans]MBM9506646.1 amino acid ABC transporter permease [Actinacidiphila acididurans]
MTRPAAPVPGPPLPTPDRRPRVSPGIRVVPQRHPWRWAAASAVLVVCAQAAHGLVTNPFFQWHRFGYWFARPVVLHGLLLTLRITALSALLGLAGGVLLAAARLSPNPALRIASWGYVWLLRSVPLIVLLLFLYNFSALYPTLSIGVPFGPGLFRTGEAQLATGTTVAVVGLSLNEAAYAAEVVRGGLLSVDRGQYEAAAALGMGRHRRFTRIVLPQALRVIVPAYVNQLINLVKATSLVFYVSLLDLFGTVETLGSTYPGDIVPLLLTATVWYVILTAVVSALQYGAERHYSRGTGRTVPPPPLHRARAALAALRARAALETAR